MTARPPDPETSGRRILIAGVSARAAAESAARAGFSVTTLDAFADLDQHPSVRALSSPAPYSAAAAARASRRVECDAVVYLSGFENHPDAVAGLARGRALWGNPPGVLRTVRDPAIVTREFRRREHAAPEVRTGRVWAPPDGEWLVKPLAGGGGHGVRRWRAGAPPPSDCYLQERVEGTPGSIVFVAAGGRAVPLAVSRQLIGESAFGAAGYRYCGSILTAEEDAGLVEASGALAASASAAFDLVGVNGIDFVARDRTPVPVEVNPRWCASMELAERAYGISVFAAHAAACAERRLPAFDLGATRPVLPAIGKAVVFATKDLTVGDTRAWLNEDGAGGVRDVPRAGERIRAGRPVCTVLADGRDFEDCRRSLGARARRVYSEIAAWGGSPDSERRERGPEP